MFKPKVIDMKTIVCTFTTAVSFVQKRHKKL